MKMKRRSSNHQALAGAHVFSITGDDNARVAEDRIALTFHGKIQTKDGSGYEGASGLSYLHH